MVLFWLYITARITSGGVIWGIRVEIRVGSHRKVVEEKCTYVMAVSGRIHYDTNKQTNKQLE
jgi:hypothetical protein